MSDPNTPEPTTQPLVYVAISAELVRKLGFTEQLERLDPVARVERWSGPGDPPMDVVAGALRHAQVVITGWGTPTLAALAEWTPDDFAVRLLAHSAGTVKHLVPMEALERGLLVTHANEALAEAVAEFTLGAIIAGRRQMFAASGRFRTNRPPLDVAATRLVQGSVVGVIGASAIGRRVMALLRPLNTPILLYDPYCPPETAAAHGATLVDLNALLQRSDIVTLHAPVTPETIGMLGAAEFAAMRDGALFINTARGRLIDHAALLNELQSGRIGAVLDVTDPTEPLPPDSPFFDLENCVVFPHIAGLTAETYARQGEWTVDEILRFLAGRPLRFAVTRERWNTMA